MKLVIALSVATFVASGIVSPASAEDAVAPNELSSEAAPASAVEETPADYEDGSTSQRELNYGYRHYAGPVYHAPAAYYAPYYYAWPRSHVRYLQTSKPEAEGTEPEVVSDPGEDMEEERALGHRHHGSVYYGGYYQPIGYGPVGYGPVAYPAYGYVRYLKGMRRAAVTSKANEDMPKRLAASRKMGHRRHGYYYAPMSYYRPYYGYYNSPYGYVRYLRRAEGADTRRLPETLSAQGEADERELSPHHHGYGGPVFYGPGYYAPVPYGPYYGSPYVRYLQENPEATTDDSPNA